MARLPAALFLSVLAGLALPGMTAFPARSQPAPEQDAGWQSDVEGLRHFTGLRCPDTIGPYSRIKVMQGDAVSLAGCVYTGRYGITAVLRKHLEATGRREALTFSRNYKAAGFEPVKLSGAAASGISFRTRNWTPVALYETLWYFTGAKADYTLWLSYSLPEQEEEIGPAVAAFNEALAAQD